MGYEPGSLLPREEPADDTKKCQRVKMTKREEVLSAFELAGRTQNRCSNCRGTARLEIPKFRETVSIWNSDWISGEGAERTSDDKYG